MKLIRNVLNFRKTLCSQLSKAIGTTSFWAPSDAAETYQAYCRFYNPLLRQDRAAVDQNL